MRGLEIPRGFVWGAATASYQIEGTFRGDGRGLSIWDTFCAQPGAIADGSNGKIACAHYQLWQQDIALLAELGVSAYRFSVSWSRVLPTGTGRPNRVGLDFYSKLVDGLLAKGITPWLTLYHWDLPQTLEDLGGWRQRETAYAFADYAGLIVKHLGDRVHHWITLNEPWCSAVLGHRTGEHAPGIRSANDTLRAAHHLMLGHGLAMQKIRATAKAPQAGITLNLCPTYPEAPTSPADQKAARLYDGDANRWYLDPIFYGRYPEDMLAWHAAKGALNSDGWSFVQTNDLATIAQPLDFLGVNYYTRAVVNERGQARMGSLKDPEQHTAMGWEVYPQGLSDLFTRLMADYPARAYYITENGAAYPDQLEAEGVINDQYREQYFARHLEQVAAICGRGIPLRGYFAWSIMDNFEWAFGYTKRFGLAYVDFATQTRTPKRSFQWLKDMIARSRQLE